MSVIQVEGPSKNTGLAVGLLLYLSVFVTLSGALTQLTFWDDELIFAHVEQLATWRKAFQFDSLGLEGRSDSVAFWRPLASLSWWLETQVKGGPLLAHATNLSLHAMNAVLVFGWLRRWTRGTVVGCAVASYIWAVVPIKAEAAAWIAGRPDVLGCTVLLFGGHLLACTKPRPGSESQAGWHRRSVLQAFVAVVFSTAALLCKESMVISPLIFGCEVVGVSSWRRWARCAAFWSSSLTVVAYLVLRFRHVGVGGGGYELMQGLDALDRVSLVLESIGHAFLTLAMPLYAVIMRGVLSLNAPGSLETEPVMGGVGMISVLLSGLLFVRTPGVRPFLWMAWVPLVPVLNLVPTGLESRMCDRYLYISLLGVVGGALYMCDQFSRLSWFKNARRGLLACVVLVLAVVGGTGAIRAYQFGHPQRLIAWEMKYGTRPYSLVATAAYMAEGRGDFVEARDDYMIAAERLQGLRVSGGEKPVVQAARAQYEATGSQMTPSYVGFARLVQCLLQPTHFPDGYVTQIPFVPGTGGLSLPCQAPFFRAYARSDRLWLEALELLLRARDGQNVVDAIRLAYERCPECETANLELARAALALGETELGGTVAEISRVPQFREQAKVARLQRVARLGLQTQGASLELQRGVVYFLGNAHQNACRVLALLANEEAHVAERLRALACTLAHGSPQHVGLSTAASLELHGSVQARRRELAGLIALEPND